MNAEAKELPFVGVTVKVPEVRIGTLPAQLTLFEVTTTLAELEGTSVSLCIEPNLKKLEAPKILKGLFPKLTLILPEALKTSSVPGPQTVPMDSALLVLTPDMEIAPPFEVADEINRVWFSIKTAGCVDTVVEPSIAIALTAVALDDFTTNLPE